MNFRNSAERAKKAVEFDFCGIRSDVVDEKGMTAFCESGKKQSRESIMRRLSVWHQKRAGMSILPDASIWTGASCLADAMGLNRLTVREVVRIGSV